MQESYAGNLLIAVPDLPDTNFYRTVVFMIEHSDDGAIGVVLNRPANVTLADLWDKLNGNLEVQRDAPVYVGGPVNGPVLALHNQYQYSESTIIDGVFMTMARDQLNRLMMDEGGEVKVFSGYSGWAPKQLENEIERGGWLLLDAEPNHVFGSPDELWKSVSHKVGNDIMLPRVLRGQNFGDPNLN